MTELRAAQGFWLTLAANMAAAGLALALPDHYENAPWLPVGALALSVTGGVAALFRKSSRDFGAGCLGGTVASALLIVALIVGYFFAYFVVGGNELS